jgi:hypothetical protein
MFTNIFTHLTLICSFSGPAVSLDSALLPAYVELFESLCLDGFGAGDADGGRGPDNVYHLLKDSQKLNWEVIWGGFRQVLSVQQQSAATLTGAGSSVVTEQYDQYGRVYKVKVPVKPPPPLSKRDVRILSPL